MRARLCLWLVLAVGCMGKGDPDAGPATLGASFQNAESLRQDGAVLKELVASGPAAQAGLRPDDLILSINGMPVGGACALERQLQGWYAGEEVELAVRRGPETLQTKVKLAGARDLFEDSCDDGEAVGCYLLGTLHAKGLEEERATELFERACQVGSAGGSAGACAELALRYLQRDGAAFDAHGFARRACEGGSAAGCSHLAYVYATGEGVPKSDASALVLYDKACEEGDANACYNAGLHHEKGRGTRADESRALAAYQRACDLGSSLGCTNLGFLHERGRGVQPDVMRAAIAYRRACEGTPCEAGDPLGCFNMGVLYRDGMGVKRDKAGAAELFQRSCDRGNAFGCANLADLYAAGEGVAEDQEKARELYRRACDGGHEDACTQLR